MINIPEFTYEDFADTTKPYEFVSSIESVFQRTQVLNVLEKKAGKLGFKKFSKAYTEYQKEVKNNLVQNYTDFEGQETPLLCGKWDCSELGIKYYDERYGNIVACTHPIMPIRRLVNIDSDVEKLELAYSKGKRWRKIIADKRTLASNTSIIQLAENGIAVNSENSRYLVRYLADIEYLNYDKIPEVNSVGRLGWIDGYGFSPYVENLIFDGNVTFKHFFESVQQKGDFEKWKEVAGTVRKGGSVQARIALASSFSSVLVHLLGALPFFVHFWGTTEVGKTVALMLSASVWANPKVGEYIHTFNSTSVSQELSATFVNSMPLIFDELQIVKDKKDFDNMIYMLTEGVGKGRGAKTGGIQKVGTWSNCIITSGEQPISNASSGGGAVNRIIEVECNSGSLFSDCRYIAETLKQNYGHAGKYFVEMLMNEDNKKHMTDIYNSYIAELSKSDATEKQSISASIILTADKLISEWIFHDDIYLTAKDLKGFLSTKTQVSAELRAYNYLLDTLVMSDAHFVSARTLGSVINDVWGVDDNDHTIIIGSKFDEIMREGGFNATALIKWLARNNLITRDETRNNDRKVKKINGKPIRCVWLKKTDMEFKEIEKGTKIPF